MLQRPGLPDANIRVFLWLDEGSWPAAWGNDKDNYHYNGTMAAKNVDGTFTVTFKQSFEAGLQAQWKLLFPK